MEESETRQTCIKFLKSLKANKITKEFNAFLATLEEEAIRKGLDDDLLSLLASVITLDKDSRLGAVRRVSLIKCLIPIYKVPEQIVKSIIIWCLSSINELPFTVSVIVIQWIIGLWDYELVDRKIINIYYDVFFYTLFKKEKMEHYLTRLIYVLTKPEDVCRRDVLRLLTLQKKYSKPPKHITALLSLFKSYKPELVPEKIQSVNIESVWKPIPESIRLALEDAKDRVELRQIRQNTHTQNFNWNVMQNTKVKRGQKPLLPSVGYFHIGSSIFKDKDAKSIFDISNIDELGKYHLNVELPCNVVSLLANTLGYHLLTFADFQYQSRFSYNLYNTLIRAFILENGKFSKEEMDKFLSMTFEFSRYMQEEILVVKLFFDEYLYYNTGEHLPKLLDLLQWMTSISAAELENILINVQNIFVESGLSMKCEIIKCLQKLITNLFVKQSLEERYRNESYFLRQAPIEDLAEIVRMLTTVAENLIVQGLNIHNFNVIFLSEALAFYEQICTLESRSDVSSWTLPPPAVIYGAFTAKSCTFLSRACNLLLRYRQERTRLYEIMPSDVYQQKIQVISTYAKDIHKALWYDEPFRARNYGIFLRTLSKEVIDDLGDCDLDSLLNIINHYAILPYRCTISKSGLNISTKEDAQTMALYYYPAVNEFLAAFHE